MPLMEDAKRCAVQFNHPFGQTSQMHEAGMADIAPESLIKLIALALGLVGCVRMHARLRNGFSFLLLLAGVLLCVHFLMAWYAFEPVERYAEAHAPTLASVLIWSMNPLIPAILWLLLALAFALAATGLTHRDTRQGGTN